MQAGSALQPHDVPSGIADVQQRVAADIEALRSDLQAPEGVSAVLRGLHLCLLHHLAVPSWLGAEFNRRFLQVSDAHVGSWDEAFGRPWPKRTRLHVVRERRRLLRLVHSAVWDMAGASNPGKPGRSINRILFDEIAELAGIASSGSKVERLYYEAISKGFPNVAEVRASGVVGNPTKAEKTEDGLRKVQSDHANRDAHTSPINNQ